MRFRLLSGCLFLAACGFADVEVCLVPPVPSPPAPRLDMVYLGCQQRTPAPAVFAGHTLSFTLFFTLEGPPLVNPTVDLLFPVIPIITIDGGAPITGTGIEHFNGFQPSPGLFQPYFTQMLQLDLQAPGGIFIHLDAGPPSTGVTQAQPLGGNVTRFSSFFDIFTDLSLDGGNTFLPSIGSTQLFYESAPEPGTFWLLLAAGGLAIRRRLTTVGNLPHNAG